MNNTVIDSAKNQEGMQHDSLDESGRCNSPKHIIDCVNRGDIANTLSGLTALIASTSAQRSLPVPFLQATASALEARDWSFFPDAFSRMEFLGPTGDFLIVAPYSANRAGTRTTRLSAIYGTTLPGITRVSPDKARVHIKKIFDHDPPELSEVIPVHVHASAGMLAGDAGEAFIVPDGWDGVTTGPALNNMSEQHKRFISSGIKCITKCWEPRSASLLLRGFREKRHAFQVRSNEYQLHDFGHATGLGLAYKVANNLLRSPMDHGTEEFRADGVGPFELGSRLLTEHRAAEVVASNLCTRFGLDAHRKGGNLDGDAYASELTFYHLIESGAITRSNGKMKFNNPSPYGLLRAVEVLRAVAVKLTREEMADPSSMWRLYRIDIPRGHSLMFHEYIVEPCRGLYNDLQ